MKSKELIEQEVRKTLKCFEHTKNIEADPFFYNRLQTKLISLENQQQHISIREFSRELCYPALLFVIVVINILVAVSVYRNNNDTTDIRNNAVNQFVQEYLLIQDDTQLNISDQ